MTQHLIRYDILTQNALRSVVRTVLADAAKAGLPGEHHFFISFLTTAPGVKLPPRLLARFPKEMTIVLQHHFADLTVSDVQFEVGLSFDGIMEHIVIPFAAVKGFYDPSVEFGMQFEVDSDENDQPESESAPDKVAMNSVAPVPDVEKAEKKAAEGDDSAASGAQVLSLDRYRKK